MAVLRFDRGTLLLNGLSAAEAGEFAQTPPWGFLMDPRVGLYRAPAYRYHAVVGRLRPCPVLDYKYVVLSHNTIRGAAGAAVLNAELLVAKGFLG